jgi:hypothetical protein
MPFELGIAVASGYEAEARVVVIDTVPHRLDRVLSDARGLDAQIVDGKPLSVFRALTNVFHRNDFQPQPKHFNKVFGTLKAVSVTLRLDFGFSSMFEPKPFAELRKAAAEASFPLWQQHKRKRTPQSDVFTLR